MKVSKQTKDKKGRIQNHVLKVWRNFSPVEEIGHGKGRPYADAVKVLQLPTGNARITERDGDQWEVKRSGVSIELKRKVKLGVQPPGTTAHITYDTDEGEEHLYYGRGYVQLTWWYNYAQAGVVLGQGLDLLFKPELVSQPDTAYSILSIGMRNGTIFANKRKLSQYFNDKVTDYTGARNMVNPGSSKAHKKETAEIAERFEKVLFASKSTGGVAQK